MAGRLKEAFRPAASLDDATQRRLSETLRKSLIGADETASAYASCLLPMLSALKWRGATRQLAEALPHFEDRFDLTCLRNVLANLGHSTKPMRAPLRDCDPRLSPFLYEPDAGGVFVVLDLAEDGVARIFDGEEGRETAIDIRHIRGVAYFVEGLFRDSSEQPKPKQGWMTGVMRRFEKQAWQLLGVTFFTNCLAMAAPLFIMAVYNKVIANQSLAALAYLGIGVGAALLFDFALKLVKARMIAYIGARIDDIIGSSTMGRILHMPPVATESAPVGAQVARIKQFESVREFFTGPFASVALELPFVFLFVAVIGALGGSLALIPVAMIAIFLTAGLILHPRMRRAVAAASAAKAKKNSFLVETLSSLRAIKQSSAQNVWLERFRDLSADAAVTGFHAAQINFAMQTVANVVMVSSGVATVAFGVGKVLDNSMSVGALIAVMALVWRVLSPLQSAFMMMSKLEGIKLGVEQINQLMRYEPESGGVNGRARAERQFAGRVTFVRASMKYAPERQPALLGVSCDIRPGEMVAVVGGNGSGKSTMLKLIAGLYRPQAGLVAIDGVDIRQLDPLDLRQSIAYVPQECKLFHGTIAQNIRLANPVATAEEVDRACALAGVAADIAALPEGLETRIGDQLIHRLPQGFRQRLALARAFVKSSPILLLDEAASGLDDAGDKIFTETLQSLRGCATIVMVTHRPSHIRVCDKVIHFEGGAVQTMGAPEEYLERLFGGKNGSSHRQRA